MNEYLLRKVSLGDEIGRTDSVEGIVSLVRTEAAR